MRDKSAIKGVISRFEAENKKFPEVSWKISENIDSSNYSTDAKYEREPLQNEEIKQLMAALDDLRDKLMVLTSIETGPRAKATTLIKLPDVNLEKKQIKLKNTKSGGTYIMPLTNELAALLEHWIQNVRTSYIINEDNPYLFPSRNNGRITQKGYNKFVYTAAKEAGIQEKIAEIPITGKQREVMNKDKDYRIKWKVDIHSLRHTFSRLLKNNEVSKEARIYALDHSRDVTDGYGIDEEACRKEIRNKFDGIDISIV
jgi:integrase